VSTEERIVTVYEVISDPLSKGADHVTTALSATIDVTGAVGFSGTNAHKMTSSLEYALKSKELRD
jgi:hypothetical protein